MPRNLMGADKKCLTQCNAFVMTFAQLLAPHSVCTFLSPSIPYMNEAKPQNITILSKEVCKKKKIYINFSV